MHPGFRVRAPVWIGLLMILAPGCSLQTGTEARVSVARVELGRSVNPDQRVAERSTWFAPDAKIHASVITSGSAAEVEIKVRWLDGRGNVVAEKGRMISPRGTLATSFQAERPGGWRIGRYKVQVLIDGHPAAGAEFEVRRI